MTTSSEDVLLQVPQVRFKKGDGTLYVMDQRLAWMLENRDTVTISHLYQDIKTQKISPEGKAKVQLQVVLHNGVSSTFHFVNRAGLQAQAADRDRVKELLQTLLPKFKSKVNKELEEKNKLLSTNPDLLQLYKDLVMTDVVSSEEFWAQHATKYMNSRKQQMQDIGVSGAFLADIKPQTDGCNGLKYNITADIIECIFKTYPAVRKKYLENVPAKLTESEFWTKFFQSHYFHRDRINTGNKDLFTECGKLDDQELKRDIQSGISDPLCDITSFEDSTLDEGFGNKPEKPSSASTNVVHQSMIKRFNQHSIMVLKASKHKQAADSQEATSEEANKTQNGLSASSRSRSKRMKIQEKLSYEDLDSNQDDRGNAKAQLSLSKVERYLHGPMPGSTSDSSLNHIGAVCQKVQAETQTWLGAKHSTSSLVNPAAAVGALGELSPGGALMRGFQQQSLAQLVPGDVEKELRTLYLALSELLKHFWQSFPPTSPTSEQKAVRMHEALQRFRAVKLKPFEDKILRELSPLSQHLTRHLNQLLSAAYRKYNTWQQRKLQLSHR